MPDMEVRINTEGEQAFRALGRRLKEAAGGKKLDTKLRANIRETARPVVEELRSAVRSVQVQSSRGGMGKPHYSRQLRARVASAVRVSVAYKGVRFNVLGSAVGPYGSQLARYLDSELPGYARWRHPVFGHHDRWVEQHGSPWFFETIRHHAADFERACERAIDEVLRDIANG